jgi:hypothetical protein
MAPARKAVGRTEDATAAVKTGRGMRQQGFTSSERYLIRPLPAQRLKGCAVAGSGEEVWAKRGTAAL